MFKDTTIGKIIKPLKFILSGFSFYINFYSLHFNLSYRSIGEHSRDTR